MATKTKRIVVVWVFSTCLAALSQVCRADDLNDGYKAYDKGDFATAFAKYTQATADGNRFAPYYLGLLYLNGQGVERDWSKAYSLFEIAIKNKVWQGACGLAQIYAEGLGVRRDEHKSFDFYLEAVAINRKNALDPYYPCFPHLLHSVQSMAGAGDGRAEYLLAGLYEVGDGVPKNPETALGLYQQAADQNVPGAHEGVIRMKALFEAQEASKERSKETQNLIELCRAMSACDRYGKFQRACATAGNVSQCVTIKMRGEMPPMRCTEDGSGLLLYPPLTVPSQLSCAMYEAQGFVDRATK